MRRPYPWLALAALLAACASEPPVDKPEYDPDRLAELNVQMGVQYMKDGRNEIALKKLLRALEYDSGYPAAHDSLGILYTRLGQTDKAERHFERAVELAPRDSGARNNYGQFLCSQGRTEEGLEMFQKALDDPLYRTPAVAHTNAGLCALRNDDAETAETHFRAALRADPGFTAALLQMARLSFQKERYMSARGYLQRYLGEAEHTPQSLWLGVRIERALGDRDTAASYALTLKSRFPDSEETRLLLQSED